VSQTTKDVLTAPEAAKLLGVSDETVRKWVRTDKIAYFTLPSGRPRFRRSDIQAIIDGKTPDEAAS
jgi:excisionase family DNA binding protein